MYYLNILKNFISIINETRSINEQFQVITKISNTVQFELEVYSLYKKNYVFVFLGSVRSTYEKTYSIFKK